MSVSKRTNAASPVRFPPPVEKPEKLADKKIEARIAAHRKAVAKAAQLDPDTVIRSGKAEIVVAGMKRSVEQIELLEAEQTRRREDARSKERRFWDSLKGPWGSAEERREVLARQEAEREQSREQRRADLEARRAAEREERLREQVAAGFVYVTGGEWSAAGSEAMAALFGSPTLWDLTSTCGDEPVLTTDDLSLLYTSLGLIAESGGVEARVRLDRFPCTLLESRGNRREILRHLERNGLLALGRDGGVITLRHGPVIEEILALAREQSRS